jgi:hypothetical protein
MNPSYAYAAMQPGGILPGVAEFLNSFATNRLRDLHEQRQQERMRTEDAFRQQQFDLQKQRFGLDQSQFDFQKSQGEAESARHALDAQRAYEAFQAEKEHRDSEDARQALLAQLAADNSAREGQDSAARRSLMAAQTFEHFGKGVRSIAGTFGYGPEAAGAKLKPKPTSQELWQAFVAKHPTYEIHHAPQPAEPGMLSPPQGYVTTLTPNDEEWWKVGRAEALSSGLSPEEFSALHDQYFAVPPASQTGGGSPMQNGPATPASQFMQPAPGTQQMQQQAPAPKPLSTGFKPYANKYDAQWGAMTSLAGGQMPGRGDYEERPENVNARLAPEMWRRHGIDAADIDALASKAKDPNTVPILKQTLSRLYAAYVNATDEQSRRDAGDAIDHVLGPIVAGKETTGAGYGSPVMDSLSSSFMR